MRRRLSWALEELRSVPIKKLGKRQRDEVSVSVREGRGGPANARADGRPDPEQWSRERAALWGGEPPVFDESLIDRVNDMNKDLADYLRDRVSIVVADRAANPLGIVPRNKRKRP